MREKSEVAFSDDEVVAGPTEAPGAQRVGQAVVHYSGQASVRVWTSAACPSAAAATSRYSSAHVPSSSRAVPAV